MGTPAIDITYDVRTDTPPGQDPDAKSPTLRRYHQILWSKPLPSGERFDLDRSQPGIYLYHRSTNGEQRLSSDGIVHTYEKHLPSLIADIPPVEVDAFHRLACTIAGYLVFPGDRTLGGMTINQARGTNARIRDRFDLTLECVRRHYAHQQSPLTETLARYERFFALFGDFRAYVDFFLLNDLTTHDGAEVKFMLDFDDFTSTDPRPRTMPTYLAYRQASVEFLTRRNQRIAAYASTQTDPAAEMRFERARAPRSTYETLEAAMEAFGLPTGNRAAVLNFAGNNRYDEFYIPPSRGYLGMRHAGSGRSDAVHYSYVQYWTSDGTRQSFDLPVSRATNWT